MTTLVCIPTYDERENLPPIVARTLAAVPDADILVIDDDSPDGTGAVADALAAADPRIHVLHRSAKQGLGAAYTAGFSWGLRRGYDVLVEMDADGSHRPEQLPDLLRALEGSDGALEGSVDRLGADLAVGSRWIPGGVVIGWPLSRRLISRAGSLWARAAMGLAQHDVTSGFRAYTAATLRAISPQSIQSEGYSFQIELLWAAVRQGSRIVEVPIEFSDRTLGRSKMSLRIVVEAMLRVTWWGITGLPTRREWWFVSREHARV